jgi:hypothetical protein
MTATGPVMAPHRLPPALWSPAAVDVPCEALEQRVQTRTVASDSSPRHEKAVPDRKSETAGEAGRAATQHSN